MGAFVCACAHVCVLCVVCVWVAFACGWACVGECAYVNGGMCGLRGGFFVVVMQCLLLLTGTHHSYTTHDVTLVGVGPVGGG